MVWVDTAENMETGGVTESIQDKRVVRTYTKAFDVAFNSAGDREPAVLSAPGVPFIGQTWSAGNQGDGRAICINRSARFFKKVADNTVSPPGMGWLWRVTCTFDTQTPKDEEEDEDDERKPREISWAFETIEEVIEKDITGEDILNSAGEPYKDPPLTREVAIPVLTLTRQEDSFDPDIILQYVNRVNEDTFIGARPFHALMAGISAQRERPGLWNVTYTIKFKADNLEALDFTGWNAFLLDAGSYYEDDDGNKVIFGIDEGEGTARIGLLDGDGGKLGDDDDPVYKQFVIFDAVNFGDLGLF